MAVVLWDSVVHYQTISQDQQLILVTTWGCPTWVIHPQPFVDIFWAWCTCHVSCWWSHVAHRPSKNVKVVSSPSLGFVFNHQPLLQYACLIFRPLVSSDDGFDTTHIHTKMVDRIRQRLAMCKLNTATYPQNLSTVADDVIPSGSGSVVVTIRLSAKKARTSTSNNLRLSNMGTSPSAFRWHLLSMMHASCVLLMISCCSPTLQECQSGLVSVPGLCLQSSTTASICLLDFSVSSIFRRQNGWQDMTKFGHVQTKHCFLPSKPINCGRYHSKWQWFCWIQLSTVRLSATTAHTGNNLRLSNMGTSPSAFRWHLLSMMHVSCILLMISCYSPTLQECQSGLVSVPGLCLQSSTTASICLLDFSASRISRQQNGWQDMAKFGRVQTKHCFLPSKPINCGRWCHSKWQWFCGFQLSTIRLSATTARTSNNLRLSNMGTSPSAFRWYLLSKMHMSCILLMISCCSPTLQEYQSGLLSVPGLCLQSSTTASICLLDFSASHIFRRWIRHHTHSHQNGWQDATKFGHVQTKHCYLPSKPFNCGGWCYSGIHYQTISQSSSY